jgi:hypothetical protein
MGRHRAILAATRPLRAVAVSAVAIVLLLVAGCGSTSRTAADGHGGTVAVSDLRYAHLPAGAHGPVLARAVARSLLDAFGVPSDAVALASVPRSSPVASAPERLATPNLVDVHRIWRVPGSPRKILALVRHSHPAGLRIDGGGSGGHHAIGQPEIETSWWVTFKADPRSGLGSETLTISMTAAPKGGTLLRADGQAVWLNTRSPAERVPAGESSIEIARGPTYRQITLRRTISAAGSVKRIVAAIDMLPIVQPGTTACPEEPLGPVVRLSFRNHTGKVLAQAAQAAGSEVGNCSPMYFSIKGHEQKPLTEGRGVIDTASQIVGVELLPRS